MKVLVVGKGIIGTIYGWALAEGGHNVTHLVRPGRADAARMTQTIDILEGRAGHKNRITSYAPCVVEAVPAADAFDLVIVPTKPYQLIDAISPLTTALPHARFLLLTQNWNGTTEIDAHLSRTRYIFGDAHAGGVFDTTRLVATLFKDIVLGDIDHRAPDVLSEFRQLFESIDIAVETPADILHCIWVQYAINAGLWTGLVRCGGLKALLHDKVNGPASLRAVAECLAVVSARGVDVSLYPEARLYTKATSRFSMWITGWLVRAMFTFNAKVKRASAHGLGDPREIAEAYSALLATGEELGVAMPVAESFAPDMRAFASRQHS